MCLVVYTKTCNEQQWVAMNHNKLQWTTTNYNEPNHSVVHSKPEMHKLAITYCNFKIAN